MVIANPKHTLHPFPSFTPDIVTDDCCNSPSALNEAPLVSEF